MKRCLLLLSLALSAAALYAFPGSESTYLPAEIQAIKKDLGDRSFGELKVSELIPVAERLNLAIQKDQYVQETSWASLWWPGAGQFRTGNWTSGVVQTGLHVGITVGSLVWANAVLPADLRLGTMDYLGTSMTNIHNAWGAHSLSDYLPTLGVLALGGVVDFALRGWSAHEAVGLAKEHIDQGKVTFEPRFDLERFGFGMGMRF